MQDPVETINWRRLDQRLTTSGQPTEGQLAQIKALGVSHIINLGPHTDKGALDDEAASVQALGMTYIYIPVEFTAPTDDHFAEFCAALDQVKDSPVHVHCIYNARVSAFFYRYAKAGLGGSETEAFATMDGIWRPGADWAAFIGDESAADQPNRYAGEDY